MPVEQYPRKARTRFFTSRSAILATRPPEASEFGYSSLELRGASADVVPWCLRPDERVHFHLNTRVTVDRAECYTMHLVGTMPHSVEPQIRQNAAPQPFATAYSVSLSSPVTQLNVLPSGSRRRRMMRH